MGDPEVGGSLAHGSRSGGVLVASDATRVRQPDYICGGSSSQFLATFENFSIFRNHLFMWCNVKVDRLSAVYFLYQDILDVSNLICWSAILLDKG